MADGKINVTVIINDNSIKSSLQEIIKILENSTSLISNNMSVAVQKISKDFTKVNDSIIGNRQALMDLEKQFDSTKGSIGLIESSVEKTFGNIGGSIYKTIGEVADLINAFETISKALGSLKVVQETSTMGMNTMMAATQSYTVMMGAMVIVTQNSMMAMGAMLITTQSSTMALGAMMIATQSGTTAMGAMMIATQSSMAATGALSTSMQLAGSSVGIFGTITSSLMGPLGIAALTIVGLAAATVLLGEIFGNSTTEADKLAASQEALEVHFANTKNELESTRTAFDELADNTLPKLKENYEDFQRTLAKDALSINIEGLDGIEDKVNETFEIVKNSVGENTDLIYQGLSSFYADSSTLSDEREQEILNNVLTTGQEKVNKAQENQEAINSILQTARDENRDLTTQDLEDISNHYQEMNQIAIDTITPAHAEQLLIQEQFRAKKGELSEEETETYLTSRQEMYDTDLATSQEHYASQLASLIKAREDNQITQDEYDKLSYELVQNSNNAEMELMKQRVDDEMLTIVGANAESIEQYKKYTEEQTGLYKYSYDGKKIFNDKESEILYNQLEQLKEKTGVDKDTLKKYNDFLDDQPEEYRAIYNDMSKEMSLDSGIEEIRKQTDAARAAGVDVTDGVDMGVKSKMDQVVGTMKELGNNMMYSIKLSLGIASPSKVMKNLLKWVPIGGAKGIEDGSSDLMTAADKMVDGVIKSTASLSDNSLFAVNSNVVPMLPLGSVVNIPEVKVPFENKFSILSGNEELKNSIKDFIISQQMEGAQKIDLYIDGTKLFNWVRKKKREYEFVTGGDF